MIDPDLGPTVTICFFVMLAAAGLVMAQERLAVRAVARVLRPEVAALRCQAAHMTAEITRRYRAGEAFDADFFRTWRLSEPQIFPAVGADFGRLPREAVGRVGYFHAQLAAARERLAAAAVAGEFQPSPYRILSCLVRAHNDVQPWIGPHIDRVTQWTPDLADANALLGELEDSGLEPMVLTYVAAETCGWPEPDEP